MSLNSEKSHHVVAHNAAELEATARKLAQAEKKNRALKKENKRISRTAKKVFREQSELLEKHHIQKDHETQKRFVTDAGIFRKPVADGSAPNHHK